MVTTGPVGRRSSPANIMGRERAGRWICGHACLFSGMGRVFATSGRGARAAKLVAAQPLSLSDAVGRDQLREWN